ncbi:hypothetical protein [Moraxella lacunata]|uniref:hypothetical protein n=1 Tax=Moraxella lacunata TaxID=477 RepID=UPI003EE30731
MVINYSVWVGFIRTGYSVHKFTKCLNGISWGENSTQPLMVWYSAFSLQRASLTICSISTIFTSLSNVLGISHSLQIMNNISVNHRHTKLGT